jgi:hypothetical protein
MKPVHAAHLLGMSIDANGSIHDTRNGQFSTKAHDEQVGLTLQPLPDPQSVEVELTHAELGTAQAKFVLAADGTLRQRIVRAMSYGRMAGMSLEVKWGETAARESRLVAESPERARDLAATGERARHAAFCDAIGRMPDEPAASLRLAEADAEVADRQVKADKTATWDSLERTNLHDAKLRRDAAQILLISVRAGARLEAGGLTAWGSELPS